MFGGQYIPDLTERFPEGFGGVDLTDTYFGGTARYPDGYFDNDDDDYMDEEPVEEPVRKFEIGREYRKVGVFGGVTVYKVEQIEKETSRILLSETWYDLDGTGTREPQWHDLITDEKGNEKCLEWESEKYGKFWIEA